MTVGPARKGWDIDLRDGERSEAALAELVGNWRAMKRTTDELGLRPHYIEHKRDEWTKTTGNLAIELETSQWPNGAGPKYPSGFNPGWTESGYAAFEYMPGHRLLVPTGTVLALAAEARQQRWIGDDNRFRNALVPIEWFVDVRRIERARIRKQKSPRFTLSAPRAA